MFAKSFTTAMILAFGHAMTLEDHANTLTQIEMLEES